MMTELKKCPFCGGNVKIVEWYAGDCRYPLYRISCDDMDCPNGDYNGDTEIEVANYWNTRPIEDALRNELETLRAQYTAACVELANCGAADRYEARMLAEGKGE